MKGDSDKRNNNTIGVSASIGHSHLKSSSHMESRNDHGAAPGVRAITSDKSLEDITVAGSQIKARKDVTLDAARDVNLIASQDTQQTSGKTAAAVAAPGCWRCRFPVGRASASRRTQTAGKGHEKGNGVWQNETTVDAGNRVTINTGRDAAIGRGAGELRNRGWRISGATDDCQHRGQRSLSNSKQNSVSGGLVTFGAGGFSGNINVAATK